MKRYYFFLAALVVVSALAIVSNLWLRRGPVHDANAVNDLRVIQYAIDNYYLSQNRLPKTLSQVQVPARELKSRLSDYEYMADDEDTYRLCATFLTGQHAQRGSGYASPEGLAAVPWADPGEHGKGHQCFTYNVMPISNMPFRR